MAQVMNKDSQAFAGYWRNSLADAALGRGALAEGDASSFLQLPLEALGSGRVPEALTARCFAGTNSDDPVAIEFRPYVFRLRTRHGQRDRSRAPAILAPIRTHGFLDRNGKVTLRADSTVVTRDLLEPMDGGVLALGTLTDHDDFLSRQTLPGVSPEGSETEYKCEWKTYLAACSGLLDQVCNGGPADTLYQRQNNAFFRPANNTDIMIANIVGLYDRLNHTKPATPLFERYARKPDGNPQNEPLTPLHTTFARRLGHAGTEFPLTGAQRQVLTQLLVSQTGDIVAVNGPPGTGKTTLLLSVVATLWAEAALKKGPPPVILAASTNNRAVTNIIDAFGKNFEEGEGTLTGRWLPDVTSYGSYFPSGSRKTEASAKYHTQDFFETIECDEYLDRAWNAYVASAQVAFPQDEIETPTDAVESLHRAIGTEIAKLQAIEDAWTRVLDALDVIDRAYNPSPTDGLASLQAEKDVSAMLAHAAAKLFGEWEQFIANESIFMALLGWLPGIKKKRLLGLITALRPHCPKDFDPETVATFNDFEPVLRSYKAQKDRLAADACHLFAEAQNAVSRYRSALEGWDRAVSVLGGDLESLSTEDLSFDRQPLLDAFAKADAQADITIRFGIFRLTTHYWEGRWLIDLQAWKDALEKDGRTLAEQKTNKRKTGAKAEIGRWHRRMMLTPCTVSTFHRLPAESEFKRLEDKSWITDYLFNFADLLIVDEAGQVLPEVAGASFSLAKRALVIGDVKQIEPIWSIPPAMDIGNLNNAGLLDGREDQIDAYDALSAAGKTASKGSVMKVAQHESRWHQIPELDRGLFLPDHYRCFNEIIAYCNDLSYRGFLRPKRGGKATAKMSLEEEHEPSTFALDLPALGYLHVDGIAGQDGGKSRTNPIEAYVIAKWLSDHKEALEQSYPGQPLSKIVGVVTPFKAQARAIEASCKKLDVFQDDGGTLTIGTVHALQGAERPIVLFSPVYTKAANGRFINQSPSMLNVAVSRAKDSFLVVGDMDVFSTAPSGSPMAILANMLFANPENELSFHFDLSEVKTLLPPDVLILTNAKEHDDFLKGLLEGAAKREVTIVSPWITLPGLNVSGLFDSMRLACQRGLKIVVYTDRQKIRARGLDYGKVAQKLTDIGVILRPLQRVHAKSVLADETVLAIGSFNWLSAARAGTWVNYEKTMVCRNKDAAGLILQLKRELDKLPKAPDTVQ